jgi:granule-bound starch synthase
MCVAMRASRAPAPANLVAHMSLPVRTCLRSAARTASAARLATIVRAVEEMAAPVMASTAEPALASKLLDVVFVATEVAPWSKTGGLGDVAGSLPVELAKRGHNVFSIAPRYDQYFDAWDTSVVVNVDGEDVRFFHSIKDGVHRVWIDHPWFLSKIWGQTGSKLYGKESGADYVDNQKRFALFCKAALESFTALPFMPGEDSVIVANDWHTALVPVYIKDVMQPAGRFLDAKVAFTIHNIAFQGRFWPETFGDLNLPESSRERFAFEDGYPMVFDENTPASELYEGAPGQKFAKQNWLRAGVTACDKLLTVSPTYAKEMASGPQLGVELNDVIAAKGIEGIVNGMDVADWNPALDKFLSFKYNAQTMESGKAYAKASLQREAGLPVSPDTPVFGFIGRLEEQKGVDILLAAIDKIGDKAQVVILGTGKKEMEAEVKLIKEKYPGVASGVVEFNSQVAHLISAGADYMMVPSRFEPCGLIQLHAMAYGTVPLVASTGGLVDTVKEGVTGFQMGAMDPDDLLDEDAEAVAATMKRAIEVFGTPQFELMRQNCISQDLSWGPPAKKWEAILTELKYPATAVEMKEQAAGVPTPVAQIETPEKFVPGRRPQAGRCRSGQGRFQGKWIRLHHAKAVPGRKGCCQHQANCADDGHPSEDRSQASRCRKHWQGWRPGPAEGFHNRADCCQEVICYQGREARREARREACSEAGCLSDAEAKVGLSVTG